MCVCVCVCVVYVTDGKKERRKHTHVSGAERTDYAVCYVATTILNPT